MDGLTILITIIFSLFSATVMSYIGLATPLVPWMGPTLILFSMILKNICTFCTFSKSRVFIPVIAGSLAGITAGGVSNTLPTFYFLQPELFTRWMAQPFAFIASCTGLILLASLLALLIVSMTHKYLLSDALLPFPIGKLVYDIGIAQSAKSMKQLISGFMGTCAYALFLATRFWFSMMRIPVPVSQPMPRWRGVRLTVF